VKETNMTITRLTKHERKFLLLVIQLVTKTKLLLPEEKEMAEDLNERIRLYPKVVL